MNYLELITLGNNQNVNKLVQGRIKGEIKMEKVEKEGKRRVLCFRKITFKF